MKWVNVNEDYLKYLRSIDSRIPYSDYGNDKYKPFFGILFEKDDLYYITQISHPKDRHYNMKEQKDFFKIYDPNEESNLLAVVNLNYMFPIPKSDVYNFEYNKLEEYRSFVSNEEKRKYISLLKKEEVAINNIDFSQKAKELYDIKKNKPQSKVSQRSLEFTELEIHAKIWIDRAFCKSKTR